MSSEKELRICFLAATLGKGGAEKQAYYMLKALKEKGHYVKLIYFEPEDSWKAPIRNLGIEVVRVSETSRMSRVKRLYQLIKRDGFHIIQATHYHMTPYAAVLAFMLRAKPIGAFRRDGVKELQAFNKLIRSVVFRSVPVFICNSKKALENLFHFKSLSGKLHYLPNVIDIPEKPYFSNAKIPIEFLAVNSLVERKRVDRMLRFIALLRKHNLPVELTILGDGPLRAELMSTSKQLGIEKYVSFKGQIDDIADFYKKADVFILSSESEGTPNVILEAMSYGKVIITSRVGESDYLLNQGEYGIICDFDNDHELNCICKKLSNDWGEMKKLGPQARDKIGQHHDYMYLYQNLKQIYQTL